MPLLVSQLNIPPSEFGLVVSAFGLSKLIGNIPSGYFVEKYGRKPSMMVGLGMCGVGLGSIGTYFRIFRLCITCVHVKLVFSLYSLSLATNSMCCVFLCLLQDWHCCQGSALPGLSRAGTAFNNSHALCIVQKDKTILSLLLH